VRTLGSYIVECGDGAWLRGRMAVDLLCWNEELDVALSISWSMEQSSAVSGMLFIPAT
jgi:hypothetical protein